MKISRHRKTGHGYELHVEVGEGDIREFMWPHAPEGQDEKEYEKMQLREAKLLIEEDTGSGTDVKLDSEGKEL